MKSEIKLFEEKKVRTVWNEQEEEWYFSVVDVVGVLTDSIDPAAYWRKLKQRLKEEGNETVTNCHGLKMLAADGKMRMTDVATTESAQAAVQGGEIARNARRELEQKTGKPAVSPLNAKSGIVIRKTGNKPSPLEP